MLHDMVVYPAPASNHSHTNMTMHTGKDINPVGGNVSFVDGHVEWIPFDGSKPANQRPWKDMGNRVMLPRDTQTLKGYSAIYNDSFWWSNTLPLKGTTSRVMIKDVDD